ncbi:hypothetical protein Mpt1_c00240 [Candidatus Methanoplasma termitum]|uniref:Uncharacterized protein n=1 Tax=Candidatus Methanoplasma termitum TaxID=1577791 RepID=A0A0A7LC78_9ARCH|nr:hypothetical protein [Candidatus Methanoplasma termitum]AIZ55932.1 hypothetical protein Mpt1_c00240 [Candidatus Methanoplasma termitum]MCL2334250.1 hypothetical protein [Candidatus Methanoplasma sp.]
MFFCSVPHQYAVGWFEGRQRDLRIHCIQGYKLSSVVVDETEMSHEQVSLEGTPSDHTTAVKSEVSTDDGNDILLCILVLVPMRIIAAMPVWFVFFCGKKRVQVSIIKPFQEAHRTPPFKQKCDYTTYNDRVYTRR